MQVVSHLSLTSRKAKGGRMTEKEAKPGETGLGGRVGLSLYGSAVR